MSSTLVSYSSGEEDDEKKRHSDANYDDVGMDMSDDEPNPAEAAMFSTKEDFEAYQKQFGKKKSDPQESSDGQKSYSEYGNEQQSSKAESSEGSERSSKRDRRGDSSHSAEEDEKRSQKRKKDADSRRKHKESRHHRHHRSRSRSRDDRSHRRRSKDRQQDDRHRSSGSDTSRRSHREGDRRDHHHWRSSNNERQESRNRKLQSLGLVSKKDETYESQLEKVKELTGVQVPKYYNPAAINPLRYAEQIKKRQMLWSKKTDPESAGSGGGGGEEINDQPTAAQPQQAPSVAPQASSMAGIVGAPASSFNKWEATNFGNDKTNEKFRRLMGIKNSGSSSAPTASGSSSTPACSGDKDVPTDPSKLTAKWFADQEQQYERARAITHTQRGLGLGFSSSGLVPPAAPTGSGAPSSSTNSNVLEKRPLSMSFMKKQ